MVIGVFRCWDIVCRTPIEMGVGMDMDMEWCLSLSSGFLDRVTRGVRDNNPRGTVPSEIDVFIIWVCSRRQNLFLSNGRLNVNQL